jgi:hypothetical protein
MKKMRLLQRLVNRHWALRCFYFFDPSGTHCYYIAYVKTATLKESAKTEETVEFLIPFSNLTISNLTIP